MSALTRVLDRHNRSLGRDPGWALQADNTTKSQADYAYDPATGHLASVVDASSSFSCPILYGPIKNLLEEPDVALLKKLRACEGWLCALGSGLIQESGMAMPQTHRGLRMRLVDRTIIKEPGDTGSQWRVLYSLSVPSWQCDFFRLTSSKGAGNGETLKYCSIKKGDCLLADRGFSQLPGIEDIHRRGGRVIVRLNEQTTPLELEDGSSLVLLTWLEKFSDPGQVGEIYA